MTTHSAEPWRLPHEPEQTLEEILRAKHPEGPFTIEQAYSGPSPFESDEEIDEFIATVREWRRADLA